MKISFKDNHFTVEHGCVTEIYNIKDIKKFIEVEEELLSIIEYKDSFGVERNIPCVMMEELAKRYNKPYIHVEEVEDIYDL